MAAADMVAGATSSGSAVARDRAAEAAVLLEPSERLRRPPGRGLRLRLLVFAAVAVLLVSAVSAALGLRALERRLSAEVAVTSAVVGRALAQEFEQALAAGIPFEELVGVEPFLLASTAFDARLSFAALLGPEGRPLHAVGPAVDRIPAQVSVPDGTAQRFGSHLAVAVPLESPPAAGGGAAAAGYVLVGVQAGLPWDQFRSFLLYAAVVTLVLLVLLREALAALFAIGMERPVEALTHLAAAVQGHDLSRTTWLQAPGPVGRLLSATRVRLGATNAAVHAFLLSAFAARAGHFEPAVLREITTVVRQGVADYRLPAVTGARPVPLSEGALLRPAAFALFLGEALLLPSWRSLPALEGVSTAGALALVQLTMLLVLPLGLMLARRLLPGFADGLVFTAGALIAAAGQLGLALADAPEAVLVTRLLSGVGLGVALQPLLRGTPLAAPLLAAGIAGPGTAILALILVGPQSVAPIAAAVTAAAALLAGQLLPARAERAGDGEGRAPGGGQRSVVRGLAPVAAFAATLSLIPAALPLTETSQRGSVDVAGILLLGLTLLFSLAAGRGLAATKRGAGWPVVLIHLLAALLLAVLALGDSLWLPDPGWPDGPALPVVLLLGAAVFCAAVGLLLRPSAGLPAMATAWAAAGGLAGALLLLQAAGPFVAAGWAALLMLASAFGRRGR